MRCGHGDYIRPVNYFFRREGLSPDFPEFSPRIPDYSAITVSLPPKEVFEQHSNQQLQRWYTLEGLRLRNLGLQRRLRWQPHSPGNSSPRQSIQSAREGYRSSTESPRGRTMSARIDQEREMELMPLPDTNGFHNTLAPFKTNDKPTCGFYFSRDIDHRKKQHGLIAADVPKWRSLPS